MKKLKIPAEYLARWILAPWGYGHLYSWCWLVLQGMEVQSTGYSSIIFILIINVLNISVVQQREPVSKLCPNAELLASWLGACLALFFARFCPVVRRKDVLYFSTSSELCLWWITSSVVCGLVDNGYSQRCLQLMWDFTAVVGLACSHKSTLKRYRSVARISLLVLR